MHITRPTAHPIIIPATLDFLPIPSSLEASCGFMDLVEVMASEVATDAADATA